LLAGEFCRVSVVGVSGDEGPVAGCSGGYPEKVADGSIGQLAAEVHEGAIAADSWRHADLFEAEGQLCVADGLAWDSAWEQPGVIVGVAEGGVAPPIRGEALDEFVQRRWQVQRFSPELELDTLLGDDDMVDGQLGPWSLATPKQPSSNALR
jgi:hypothetical protein